VGITDLKNFLKDDRESVEVTVVYFGETTWKMKKITMSSEEPLSQSLALQFLWKSSESELLSSSYGIH
jgi:hypothetical protein